MTVLLSEPKFSFKIYSCGVSSLSDFYTYFVSSLSWIFSDITFTSFLYSYQFNPTPNYEKTLICTQERVYPLQTIVLIFYSSCVVSMLILRPFVMKSPINEKSSLYYALYAFPLLGLIYAVAGGFIYFSFPYISIIISCAANAGHFAMKQDMDMKQLLVSSCSLRNLIIISECKFILDMIKFIWISLPLTVGNWLLFSFGIVSIKEYAFLVLAPFSSIFYILTSKYTNPVWTISCFSNSAGTVFSQSQIHCSIYCLIKLMTLIN